MTTSEINTNLIGKKVKGIFTSMGVTGTIIGLVDDQHSAGVEIELDRPVVWGDYTYNKYQSTARKHDQFGNLKYTELI